MRKIYLLLLLFASYNLLSQSSYDSIIQPRKEISITKNGATIIKNISNSNIKLDFLCDQKLVRKFTYSVFRYSNKNSKTVYYLKQWNTPIIVYFDKKIPKEVTNKFKAFFSKFNTINNLKIHYTTNIEKANYQIKVSNRKITKYIKNIKFKSDKEKINYFLYNATYNLQTDNNMKFYSGTIQINTDEFNNDLLLKKLKQLFYITLGNFTTSYSSLENSLLNLKYADNATISDIDFNFIKAFYEIIYTQKINGTTFSNLNKLAQKNCNK